VRGSTVDGVFGWPERGGAVCGMGGGAWGGAGVVDVAPESVEGDAEGRPVRESIVEGRPTGGLGATGDEGAGVDGIEFGRELGMEPVWARTEPAASVTRPRTSAAVRAGFIEASFSGRSARLTRSVYAVTSSSSRAPPRAISMQQGQCPGPTARC
jgi:hypothetical protein